MIALVAAMNEEASGVKRRMKITKAVSHDGLKISHGTFKNKEMLLVLTGVGKERAEKAMTYLLANYPVSTLVSFGFGGALIPEAKVGDVFLCETICQDGGQSTHTCDETLLEECMNSEALEDVNLRKGKIVSALKACYDTSAKKALGKTYGCEVVDMETFWVAELAARKRVRFVSVRSISDTLEEKTPPFDLLIDGRGKWRTGKAIIYFAAHPNQIFRLARNSKIAGDSLTEYMGSIIEKLS